MRTKLLETFGNLKKIYEVLDQDLYDKTKATMDGMRITLWDRSLAKAEAIRKAAAVFCGCGCGGAAAAAVVCGCGCSGVRRQRRRQPFGH